MRLGGKPLLCFRREPFARLEGVLSSQIEAKSINLVKIVCYFKLYTNRESVSPVLRNQYFDSCGVRGPLSRLGKKLHSK